MISKCGIKTGNTGGNLDGSFPLYCVCVCVSILKKIQSRVPHCEAHPGHCGPHMAWVLKRCIAFHEHSSLAFLEESGKRVACISSWPRFASLEKCRWPESYSMGQGDGKRTSPDWLGWLSNLATRTVEEGLVKPWPHLPEIQCIYMEKENGHEIYVFMPHTNKFK